MGLVSNISCEVVDSVWSSSTFTELSDLTALAVLLGPPDTTVPRHCLSCGGVVQAALAVGAGGTTTATLCGTVAGAETCGAAPGAPHRRRRQTMGCVLRKVYVAFGMTHWI